LFNFIYQRRFFQGIKVPLLCILIAKRAFELQFCGESNSQKDFEKKALSLPCGLDVLCCPTKEPLM